MIGFTGVSEARFSLAYDGEAVRAGSMDVHELAPALLAVGDLVQQANRILNGERATVSTKVESDFRRGSFEVSLLLDQGIVEQAKAFLFGQGITDADTLLKVLFGGTSAAAVIAGVLKILKALRGEKPKQITLVDNSTMIIQTGSGQILNNVDKTSAELYAVDSIRESAERIVRPLERPGIDSCEVRTASGERIDYTSKDEAIQIVARIEGATESGEQLVSTREALLKIIKLSFAGKQKWGFSDGTTKFSANVTDKDFQRRVHERREGFFDGDALRVILQTIQVSTGHGNFRSDYTVERVIEHLPAPRQARLPEI